MPITASDMLGGKGLHLVCSGIITGQDIITLNHGLLGHPERLQNTQAVVVSFAPADALKINGRESQIIGQQLSLMGEFLPQGSVIALVAPKDDLFAVASIWEQRITCECCQAAAFREIPDAEVWTCQKLRENFGLAVDGLGLCEAAAL